MAAVKRMASDIHKVHSTFRRGRGAGTTAFSAVFALHTAHHSNANHAHNAPTSLGAGSAAVREARPIAVSPAATLPTICGPAAVTSLMPQRRRRRQIPSHPRPAGAPRPSAPRRRRSHYRNQISTAKRPESFAFVERAGTALRSLRRRSRAVDNCGALCDAGRPAGGDGSALITRPIRAN